MSVPEPLRLDPNVSEDYQSALAAAFYWKACDTPEGPERLAQDVVGVSLRKLVAVASGTENENTLRDEVGGRVSYGSGFRVDQILDILIFLHGKSLSREVMNAAADRAAYRRRKSYPSAEVYEPLANTAVGVEYAKDRYGNLTATRFDDSLSSGQAQMERSGTGE